MQFQWPVLAHLIISTFDFVARFGGDRNNSPHRVIEPFVPESHRFSKCFYDVIENPNNAKNWYFRSPPAREKARPGGAGARIGRIFGPCARRAARGAPLSFPTQSCGLAHYARGAHGF
ncbi:hypothetical protein [Burkholderia glumae]|uniref:hypothetical protein n=1 Tax=Burkholderia glumae TaxID=337 RepID=UPI00159336B5|nr:hypothetical protein [Burkholderia glumae]MCM2551070.1 hypothetical protein [Burkholderia glumae]NVE26011.1 hypothetical protein [Burkholderia glumae]